MYSPKLKILW